MSNAAWLIVGVVAGIVFGAAVTYLAIQTLMSNADRDDAAERTLVLSPDEQQNPLATKDDGPHDRDEAWWRDRGAK